MRILTILTSLFLLLSLSACDVIHSYHPPVQQGNVLSPDQVGRLRLGMSKYEVQQILGSPVLVNNFRSNEYDYVYSYYVYGKPMQEKNLILTFKNERLNHISRQGF